MTISKSGFLKLLWSPGDYSHVPIKQTVRLAFRAKKSFMYGTFNRVLFGFLQIVCLIRTGHFNAYRVKNSDLHYFLLDL